MNRTRNCAECEYIRLYNYGKQICYCDHEDRDNDMGKLSVGCKSETSPEWCPLKEKD